MALVASPPTGDLFSWPSTGPVSSIGTPWKLRCPRPYKSVPIKPVARKGANPYEPFFIPQSVLSTPSQHQNSRLLNLPPEVLLLVIEQIRVPYFQVSLTLTCKTIAEMISRNTSVLAPWRGFRDKDGLLRLLAKQGRYRNESGLQKLSPWMPSQYRVCRACFRFVPRSRQYWQIKFEEWGVSKYDDAVNWNDVDNFLCDESRIDGQHKCPECSLRGNTCFMGERQYLNSDFWDTCEGDSNYMLVVKLDLRARIDRP